MSGVNEREQNKAALMTSNESVVPAPADRTLL